MYTLIKNDKILLRSLVAEALISPSKLVDLSTACVAKGEVRQKEFDAAMNLT